MKQQFVINGYCAFSELDSFENGCHGKSQYESVRASDWSCEADSFQDLIDNLKREFKATSNDDFLLNSCDELGRLDLQVYQREAFNCARVSEASIESWKAGKIDLYLTCYTFQVSIVQTEIDLMVF